MNNKFHKHLVDFNLVVGRRTISFFCAKLHLHEWDFSKYITSMQIF